MEPFYRLLPLMLSVNRLLSRLYGPSAHRKLQNIYRAYMALKMDDIERDEKSRLRRFNARIIRRACAVKLPKQLETLVRESSREIEKLEASNTGLEEYVENLSRVGGKIFCYGSSKKEERMFLWGLGSSIVATLTLRDMIRDLKTDLKKGTYNPLKHCPSQRAKGLLERYYSQLAFHIQNHSGLLYYAPRGGMCAGWSQVGFCFLLCMEVMEEGLGAVNPAPPTAAPGAQL